MSSYEPTKIPGLLWKTLKTTTQWTPVPRPLMLKILWYFPALNSAINIIYFWEQPGRVRMASSGPTEHGNVAMGFQQGGSAGLALAVLPGPLMSWNASLPGGWTHLSEVLSAAVCLQLQLSGREGWVGTVSEGQSSLSHRSRTAKLGVICYMGSLVHTHLLEHPGFMKVSSEIHE